MTGKQASELFPSSKRNSSTYENSPPTKPYTGTRDTSLDDSLRNQRVTQIKVGEASLETGQDARKRGKNLANKTALCNVVKSASDDYSEHDEEPPLFQKHNRSGAKTGLSAYNTIQP